MYWIFVIKSGDIGLNAISSECTSRQMRTVHSIAPTVTPLYRHPIALALSPPCHWDAE